MMLQLKTFDVVVVIVVVAVVVDVVVVIVFDDDSLVAIVKVAGVIGAVVVAEDVYVSPDLAADNFEFKSLEWKQNCSSKVRRNIYIFCDNNCSNNTSNFDYGNERIIIKNNYNNNINNYSNNNNYNNNIKCFQLEHHC
jgi:hypothetical protein